MSELDFDLQAAWLRRFSADAQSNLGAFARRLKEAMPELVTIQEKKGFFAKTGTITGVSIELGENRYQLELAGGRLQASIAMVVRGITLNTKAMDPADWFTVEHLREIDMREHAVAARAGGFTQIRVRAVAHVVPQG